VNAEFWSLMSWSLAAGYAAITFAYAARGAHLNRADTALTVSLITVQAAVALTFIFSRDEGPALVCAGIIALVGAAYSEQGRRAHEADAAAAVRRPRGQRRYH
jgi:hypothetical protein